MTIGIDPKVDFAFKKLLGSPDHPAITLHFLNAAGQYVKQMSEGDSYRQRRLTPGSGLVFGFQRNSRRANAGECLGSVHLPHELVLVWTIPASGIGVHYLESP